MSAITHFAGHIMARICAAMRDEGREGDGIAVSNLQQNSLYGVQQARVMLEGDPVAYRLILAPADAPIEIDGRPIGDHFSKSILFDSGPTA